MIVTITLNPAIDKTVYENKTVFDIGGKGINVSKVLAKLNVKSIATGFIGKENKDLVISDLDSNGIENHFIEVEGKVRTNTKRIINNNLIEENEDGPNISEDNIKALFDYLKEFNNDIVVISGSAPSSVNKNIYKDIINFLKINNNYIILDCAGELLRNGIEAKPNIIKPNKQEICELLNAEYNEDYVINECKKIGLDLMVVSLGEGGALFIGKDVYKYDALKVNYKSSVGAGDSLIAGLIYSKLNNFDKKDTMKMAMACAGAACETEGTKAPNYEDIIKMFNVEKSSDKI